MLSVARKKQIEEFVKILNIEMTDEMLLNEALTHPSYNFEGNISNSSDYERLEFLGDSVVRLIISDYLFEKYNQYDEGKLTKIRSCLVSDEFLSKIAFNLKVDEFLNIGIHEEKDGGRKKESIVACAMEAIFGAIYKNNGYEYTKNFVINIYNNINFNPTYILQYYNSKEILQQYTQSVNKDLPIYQIVNETGQAHNKTYEVSVSYHDEQLGIGVAKTKKEAEKIAAMNALKKLNLIEV
jgi:ribonuclease-3